MLGTCNALYSTENDAELPENSLKRGRSISNYARLALVEMVQDFSQSFHLLTVYRTVMRSAVPMGEFISLFTTLC